MRIYGDDSYIVNAFKYARQYAPAGCKLFLNDYNEYVPAKTTDIYNMAIKLKANGTIDGIGMQSHLDVSYPSASVYRTALEKFISTGLEVQITELDITCGDTSAQANLHRDIFSMAAEKHSQITSLTVWGTHDSISWRASENPLLFGKNYSEKEASRAVFALAKTLTQPVSEIPTSQTNSVGRLTASAEISGGAGISGGTVTIPGGLLTAKGGVGGAGGTVTILGGTVVATGGNGANDIGNGFLPNSDVMVVISGGSVRAMRNNILSPVSEKAGSNQVHCVTLGGLPQRPDISLAY